MIELLALDSDSTFPVKFVERHLEAGSEGLEKQKGLIPLTHFLFIWHPNWVSE